MKYSELLSKTALFETLTVKLSLASLSDEKIHELVNALYFEGEYQSFEDLKSKLSDPVTAKQELDRIVANFAKDKYSKSYTIALDLLHNLYEPKTSQFPSIDSKVQEALRELDVYPDLQSDGKLGPQTVQALNLFKKQYNTNATGQKLFDEILNAYRIHRSNKQPVHIPDSSKKYDETWRPESINKNPNL